MTFTRLHISVFLAIAVLAWGAVLGAQGVQFTWSQLKNHLTPFSAVVAVLAALGLALEHYAWPLPMLHGWFVKRPDLRGTWRVVLQSSWVNPDTNLRVPPIACFMGVTQTLSTLQMHLMTPESESWFVADHIRSSPNGRGYQVLGVYENRPDIHLRDVRSQIHRGALMFDTHGPENLPSALSGEYWTDRRTSGTMHLEHRVPEVFTRYSDAAAAWPIPHKPSE